MVASLIAALTITVLGASIAIREVRNRTYAKGLVEQVLTAEITDVADLVNQLQPYRNFADPLLFTALDKARTSGDERVKLRASLALLSVDSSQFDYLKDRLLDAGPEQV
jgi:hypothetical protein